MSVELIDALKALSPSVGRLRRRYVNASQSPYTIALSDTEVGIIDCPSSGNTEIIVPKFSDLGWTRSASDPVELVLSFNNSGLGAVSVVPKQTVTGTNDCVIDWRGMEPATWTNTTGSVSIVTNGADSWVRL